MDDFDPEANPNKENDKVLKSELHILESESGFIYKYDFTKRRLWNILFGKKIEYMNGIEKREIELEAIFKGI